MKLTPDGIVSDSGHTFLWREPNDGRVCWFQHSIAEQCLTEEDKRMKSEPEECWTEFWVEASQDLESYLDE